METDPGEQGADWIDLAQDGDSAGLSWTQNAGHLLTSWETAFEEELSSVEIVSSLRDVPGILATGLSNWLSAVVSMFSAL